MEADGPRRYSVLTRTEVRVKMVKEINQISEVFSLSKSDATVILMRLRWNSYQAADRLGDEKEKFLAELGLVRVSDSKQNQSDSSSQVLDGDYLVSTPFCSHKFPATLWRDYLSDSLEKNREVISCLEKDCVASVGPDTVVKLPESMKFMYESYMLRSFVECNKNTIKWCPAKGCGYAIELHDEEDLVDGFGVVCLCGYLFCWKCQLESHRPVTCKFASLWLNKLLDQARSLVWIATNTKPCPECNSPVGREGDSEIRLVTCICSCTFCWVCSRSEAEHQGKWNCAHLVVFRPPVNQEKADSESALMCYLNLWDSGNKEIDNAINELHSIMQYGIPKLTDTCCLGERDIKAIRDAWTLIVQCQLVLKWSCVFEYFITVYQNAKKAYMNHLREKANTTLVQYKETLQVFIQETISSGGLFNCFSHKVETMTATTGNYFHEFIKSLEDGLVDVKMDAYENALNSFWFCGCCTFQNSLFDKVCRVCYVAPASSSSGVASDDNHNADTDHGQTSSMPKNQLGLDEEEIKHLKIE